MSVVELPDVERIVALLLADHDDLVDLAGRVYTVTPKEVGDAPFVLVQRFGGEPPFTQPLVMDHADLQVGAYGGSRRQAHTNARRVQAVLAELLGNVTDGVVEARVTGTRLGAFRWLPDELWNPPRARYVLDVTVYVRTARRVPVGVQGGAAVTATGTATVVNGKGNEDGAAG